MATVDAIDAPGIDYGELPKKLTRSPSSFGSASPPDTRRDLRRLLSRFEPISLREMEGVALLDRTDTKYVLGAPQLHSLLGGLAEHYRVLEVRGNRLSDYRTVYFDTQDFLLYRHHHSGRRLRYKVRSREYVQTEQSFLEVKRKGKRDRTLKERVRVSQPVTRWVPEAAVLMGGVVPGEGLEAKVTNEFCRITLVGSHHQERVTLDLELEFQGGGRAVALPGVVVAEVKQEGVDRRSEFVRQMRAAGVRPRGFSKYCMGVALLYQGVKHNRFKANLRLMGKLMGDDCGVW